jgi:hypothetical protein
MDSTFLLADGRLTLQEIMKQSFNSQSYPPVKQQKA